MNSTLLVLLFFAFLGGFWAQGKQLSCEEYVEGVLWSEWEDRPIADSLSVQVPNDIVLILDVSPPKIQELEIFGELRFHPEKDIRVDAEEIHVFGGGHLWIGSENCRATGSINIVLHGERKATDNSVGYKVISVSSGGQFDVHGEYHSVYWTQLAATAQKSATSITLAEGVDWKVGDQIVIAATDWQSLNTDYFLENQNEVREIISITGTTIQFNQPLDFPHFGEFWRKDNKEIDLRGEIGLLSRNIKIQGDISGNSGSDGWGGHIIALAGSEMRIEGTELFHMGQRNELARYPIHFHVAGEQKSSYIIGNSIHSTFQRCVTIHGTDGVLVKNNVAFNASGHCYFIEDGNERENVFTHNLGIYSNQHTLLVSDSEPAIFWITNADNHFYDNAAVGPSDFGFWYSMPSEPLGLAHNPQKAYQNLLRFAPMGDFVGNRAHSTHAGLFIDRGQINNEGEVEDQTSYHPRSFEKQIPFLADQKSIGEENFPRAEFGIPVPALVLDFTAFKCLAFGIWGRGDHIQVVDAKLADNIVGTSMPEAANVVQDSVFVGETNNIGNYQFCTLGEPGCEQYWPDEEGRSYPFKFWLDHPIIGYQSYDAGGGDIVIDSSFYDFNDHTFSSPSFSRTRKSGALGGQMGPNILQPLNFFSRLSFSNVDNVVFFYEWIPEYIGGEIIYKNTMDFDDAMKGIVLIDQDGSITGDCGSQIVGNGAHLRHSGCVRKDEWNAYHCPNDHTQVHRSFVIDSDITVPFLTPDQVRNLTFGFLTHLEDKASVEIRPDTEKTVPGYEDARLRYGTNILTRTEYLFQVGTISASLGQFNLQMVGMEAGEWVRFAFPFPLNTNFTILRSDNTPFLRVNTKSELVDDSFFYDETTNLLWINLVAFQPTYVWVHGIPIHTGYSMARVIATCPNEKCEQTIDINSIPNTPPSSSQSQNLCRKHAIQRTYTPLTNRYDLFSNGEIHSHWIPTPGFGDTVCKIIEGMESTYLQCSLYQTGPAWNRDFAYFLNTISPSLYTHFELKIRSRDGFGITDLALLFLRFNGSVVNRYITQINTPGFLSSPVNEDGWRMVYLDLEMTGVKEENDIAAFAFFPVANRPMEFEIESMALVEMSVEETVDNSFPPAPSIPELVGPGANIGPSPENSPTGAPGVSPSGASRGIEVNLGILVVLGFIFVMIV